MRCPLAGGRVCISPTITWNSGQQAPASSATGDSWLAVQTAPQRGAMLHDEVCLRGLASVIASHLAATSVARRLWRAQAIADPWLGENVAGRADLWLQLAANLTDEDAQIVRLILVLRPPDRTQ